ncbi:putative OmpA/MotB domain protein [Candidatus Filomicrobium marinum]|uniref:Phosphate transport system substrate-binding protein n=2 Tax=Filomicrobium TaxID=119044 RepID=A0A1H0NPX0_9HYPH|nr:MULTISPECIES: phosphate ABC transporter substrate-binding/OmpA family protein [Filomicrobium]CFX54608.1 putative OmpA/MotB domain protein [Candidatus Filomicrobium marinum]CPR22152.1 putative OmpA/MotB domain protein [Candidatus Filomicrobium marinum]SDO94812.1 phosphate transport system substrate-binding protein [Filomicrobium insigne]
MAGWVSSARAVCVLILFSLISSFTAAAEEVRLRLKGGDFEIVGDLVSFDGRTYVVLSPLVGRMKADASRFECIGGACPNLTTTTQPIPAKLAPLPASGKMAIAGSHTIGHALMPALIEAYADTLGLSVSTAVGSDPKNTTVKLTSSDGRHAGTIDLRRQGSDTAFTELRAKTSELTMSSRPIADLEATGLAAAGLGNMHAPTHEHVLALDGLVVLVSPDNPVVAISITDLARVFAGEITDWSELGGREGAINLYAPADGSGTLDTFQTLVLEPNGKQMAESAKRTSDDAERSNWIIADPSGITFASIAYQRNAKALNIESSCGLISRPSRFAMKTEEYPLTRRLYLYTPGRPKNPLAARFLDFTLSEQAQPAIARTDFIDLGSDSLTFRDQGARIAYALNAHDEDFDLDAMRQLISEIAQAERLTTTFRFKSGSVGLDNKGRQDIERLVTTVQSPKFRDRQLLVLGFSDAVGGYDENLRLSEVRATAVADLLKKSGVTNAIAKGYGELAPVACNDTPASRNYNRRVEIWVK